MELKTSYTVEIAPAGNYGVIIHADSDDFEKATEVYESFEAHNLHELTGDAFLKASGAELTLWKHSRYLKNISTKNEILEAKYITLTEDK